MYSKSLFREGAALFEQSGVKFHGLVPPRDARIHQSNARLIHLSMALTDANHLDQQAIESWTEKHGTRPGDSSTRGADRLHCERKFDNEIALQRF